MAQLCNAVDGGHFFILAGRSQGTFQVDEEGVQWLRKHCYRIPEQGERVYLDRGTYLKLKDMGYLGTKGYENDNLGQDSSYSQSSPDPFARGFPLLMRIRNQKEPAWELYLDLSDLNEEVWEELRIHHTDFITASNAFPISQRQLIYAHGLLHVYPFPHPYQIFSNNSNNSKQLIQQAPETPGLNDNWQGNIFLERTTQIGTWQRRLPGSSVMFSGELLWLAKADCKLDWPGQAARVGNAYIGWQLWRLTVNETALVAWESIQNWFIYRSINVVLRRQRIEIVSPPTVVTEDGGYLIEPGRSIWIACYPADENTHSIFREIALSAENITSTTHDSNPPSKSTSASCPADRINYFRWSARQLGNYRIRIQDDVSAEPLLVQANTVSFPQPQFLHALSCTITSAQDKKTYYAFSDVPYTNFEQEPYILNQFTLQELPTLAWACKPEHLPVQVIWNAVSTEQRNLSERTNINLSEDELTWYWREKICPIVVAGSPVKVILNAGSFGCIYLLIALSPRQRVEPALRVNEQQIAQFSWLSRMIGENQEQRRVPMPVSLRETLRQLSAQADSNSPLRSVLEKLAAANTIPTWVYYRLRVLLTEVESIQTITTHNKVGRRENNECGRL